jgi:hypothetical protein
MAHQGLWHRQSDQGDRKRVHTDRVAVGSQRSTAHSRPGALREWGQVTRRRQAPGIDSRRLAVSSKPGVSPVSLAVESIEHRAAGDLLDGMELGALEA